ncbi:hypothetical protein KIN20_013553 [Parelaphostrongylus tenuis]|uniref:G-protein coupled receptors family 1 profile domain-containing protein n=1 Tax=Parelaphostrongylus tenuis TaxID=148309 RepID=A0AAD5MGV3_PARTN|nr:hypothetical protein KIN20_013553 [Parelaphostrongylus tenuis]
MSFMFSSREKSLRQNLSQQVVVLLTITDFIFAVTILPFTVYFIISWNADHLNLSSHYVIISCIPVVAFLKINLTLTISIALERTLALYFPLLFRKLYHHSYALFSLLFGSLLAVLDLVLEFSLSSFKSAPNCAAIGCFLSKTFSSYWGISSMMMGIVVIILTILVFTRLRAIWQNPHPSGVVNSKEKGFTKTNRRSIIILFSSLVSVTLTSVGQGLANMIGFRLANNLGPLNIIGLLCAGACSSVVFISLNKEIRETAKNFIFRKNQTTAVTTMTGTLGG